jgi:hypothetical protein
MNTFAPLDLIRAHQWSNSFFTTYSLSLSFFEAVVLDALVRQNVERTLILADVTGVRAAVAEYGSRCAGRVYEIEPVAVEHGCFHPKFLALTSPTEAHIVVSSGNLTFGGWGSNLECIEHLHPGVAADAFDDAADFLESLASVPWAKHYAQEPCNKLAEQLRRFAAAGVRTGAFRLLHSLERPILEQLCEIVEDMGGATSLTLAAPFHDGLALDRICGRLQLDDAFVHAHSDGSVAGSFGSNWPAGASVTVKPVTIALFAEDTRRLHAKAFEIVCRRGRVVMSGSANATLAALGSERNVELCVARIQRDPVVAWHVAPSSAPVSIQHAVDEEKIDPTEGVLRAILEGDVLNGWVLTPFPEGNATVSRLTAFGWIPIDETLIKEEGRFTVVARDVEREAWTTHRLILRVRASTGEVASGFVSFADFAEIKRHLGSVASRLFALLAGTETPDDVAAVMSWFHEHPEYLSPHAGGGSGQHKPPIAGEVSVFGLLNPGGVTHAPESASGASGTATWRRFVELILECFRERRGPISSEDEADEKLVDGGKVERKGAGPAPSERDLERPLSFFDKLLDQMLGGSSAHRSQAFWVTHYVCDRLEPDAIRVGSYLKKLMTVIVEPPSASDRDAVAAAVLVWSRHLAPGGNDPLVIPRITRRKLLRVGADLTGAMPDMTLVQGFTRILAPDFDFEHLWEMIRSVRTSQEEIKEYRLSGTPAAPGPEFPYLAAMPEFGNISAAARKRLIFMPRYAEACPYCHLVLPSAEAFRLRESEITRADCCGRILLCEEI